uniref:Uncharacterized protein n=1 Tax=Octopus bimaculoides TaxID=37653 RepID=A0A0L8HT88_OCTBM
MFKKTESRFENTFYCLPAEKMNDINCHNQLDVI